MAAVLLAALILAPIGINIIAWADPWPDGKILFPPYKEEMPLEDNNQILVTRKANVLFVLDTGSPMTFTANGKMPEWGVNVSAEPVETGQQQAGAMLREATYGHGGLPVLGNTFAPPDISPTDRYGREGPDSEDEDNNITMNTLDLNLHLDNYYSPFNYADHPLGVFGVDSEPMPYALVFKNSDWWKNGPPQGTQLNKSDLVPNDSRMYKMKLVMWRVLSDMILVENLRIGLATTYQEMNTANAGFYADYYKTSPYGAFDPNFPHGTAPGWSTKLSDIFYSVPPDESPAYRDATSAFWGINRDYYEVDHNDVKWKLLNRAYLRVPMDDYSSEHLGKFRLWIDGYENVNESDGPDDPYYFKNPELFGDGKTFLSTAIYPGHNDLSRQDMLDTTDPAGEKAITFSSTQNEVKAAMNASYIDELFNHFKIGSGEALGTLLDFFSPPVSGIGEATASASNVEYAPEVSFPLSDPCDKNWVVIFTAGDDSSEYSSAEAVEDLYNHTKSKALTALSRDINGNPVKDDKGKLVFKPISLDEGVRTLVVGFVSPDSEEPDIVGLRDKLDAMAKAGDPNNPDAKAYFANDVSGLIQALRAVLARINSEIQPAAGPLTESPMMGDEEETSPNHYNIFSAGYRINKFDQWNGKFSRYLSIKSGDSITKTELWELGRDLHSSVTPGSRNLVYWNGAAKSFQTLAYTVNKDDATPHPQAGMFGVTAAFVESGMDASNISSIPSGQSFSGKLHPSRALVNWLHGFEYSYIETAELKRRSLLSDFGQSTSVIAGPPQIADSLPGYKAWAELPAQKALQTRIYAQTNDGILHVINPTGTASQREQMAIVPPPSLLPLRLAGLKMSKVGSGGDYKMRWLDVMDFMTKTSDDIPISSKPAYVLDGPVRMRYFDMGAAGGGWKSILIAMLGRGGNGLYTMDVSRPDAPTFYWYRETLDNDDGTLTLVRMRADDASPTTETVTPKWDGQDSIYSDPDKYPFYQLGFNSLNPAAGVSRKLDGLPGDLRNMIVLPGGMQKSFDLNNNGRMGAALYIIDPDASKHDDFDNTGEKWAKVFNSGSVDPFWRVGSANSGPDPYMGMMVSAPALRASQYDGQVSKYVADQVYASDNRGNIFALLLEPDAEPSVPSAYTERLLTAGTLRKNGDEPTDSYSSPYSVVISGRTSTPNVWWVSGGTANVAGSSHLKNKSQLIYSFKLPDFTDGTTSRRDDWVELKSNDISSKASAQTGLGWYIPLEPDGTTPGHGEEYVSAQHLQFGNQIFFATFLPKKTNTNDGSNMCGDAAIDGKARIYALDADTGWGGRWSDGNKFLEFEGAKIVGMTKSEQGGKKTLAITLDVFDRVAFAQSVANYPDEGISVAQDDSAEVIINIQLDDSGEGSGTLPPETSYINYWFVK
ncbi:MAG: hypothetical protein LBG29_08160 [Synergistaceae bacterium]|nr:hypothetical protein [Synergistaceae bacterium]